MPEEAHPAFLAHEQDARLSYFTLPMALNYQRDSYKLWEAALKTYTDPATRFVLSLEEVCTKPEEEVREALLLHRLALQPNKHVATWRSIAKTVYDEWGSFEKLLEATEHDFLLLKEVVQGTHKKGFPYLSGPKIFNYWAFILTEYGLVPLKNREHIDIAPDTHVLQGSVRLGVITQKESETLAKEEVSARWRCVLAGSGIAPIDMHAPLWFWSRNGFIFDPVRAI
jgi:hypothetical protein